MMSVYFIIYSILTYMRSGKAWSVTFFSEEKECSCCLEEILAQGHAILRFAIWDWNAKLSRFGIRTCDIANLAFKIQNL
jgi:hypothetical protein